MKWFRFYSETLDDPKVQRLSPHLFKFWVNLLSVASSVPHRGILPSVSVLAFRLRISEERAVIGVDELVARGLLDRDDDQIQIHNWDKWQFDSDNVTARTQRFKERSRNVPGNVLDTEQSTDTEQKQSKNRRRATSARNDAGEKDWLKGRYDRGTGSDD